MTYLQWQDIGGSGPHAWQWMSMRAQNDFRVVRYQKRLHVFSSPNMRLTTHRRRWTEPECQTFIMQLILMGYPP